MRTEVATAVFWWKRNIRRVDKLIAMNYSQMRCMERIVNKLKAENSPFNKARIEAAQHALDAAKKAWRNCLELNHDAYRSLMSCLVLMDRNESMTSHDKAQIIGVHHSHIDRIEKEHGESDLTTLVALHAELAGEDWSGNRAHTLFDAYRFVSSEMFMKSKDMRDKAFSKLQELAVESTGHPLQTYCLIVRSDGTKTMEPIPPELRVVS